MLNKAFDGRNLEGLIFHSVQRWQYQHQSYQQRMKNNDIKQSMSRKGNSMDELILSIDGYINYYNDDRIKVKLKGLSPVNYRLQSSN